MSTTPTPAPSGGSNYDQIGAALSSPEPSQAETVSTETPPETTGAPVEAEPASTTEATTSGQVESQAPADQAPAETNPYEADEGEDVAPQTLNTLLASDRGRQIYHSFKTLREFAKPLDQGGIGHVPSVNQIRDYYSTYRDRVMMDNDLATADQPSADRVLGYVFNPQRGEATNSIAQQLAPTLARLNPETYAAAAQPFITNYAGALFERYQQAKESGDEKLRSALWYAANVANYDMTGKWLTDAAPANGAANGHAKDPLAMRQAELDQREQAIHQQQQQSYQQQVQQWNQAVNGRIGQAVNGEIDKALAPLKATSAPRIYESLRRDFHNLVVSGANRDPHAYSIYMARVQEAKRDGSVDLPAEFVRLIQPVIKAERKKFLEEAGVTIKQQSDARHAELRQVDQQNGLSNGGGAGPSPVSSNPVARQPGESSRDFNLRQLRAITG